MEKLFYFICYPQGDKSEVTVIDEKVSMHYEKNDYSLVNELEWDNVGDAIDYAKKLAQKYNLTYVPFKSRYGCDNDEEKVKREDYLYLQNSH